MRTGEPPELTIMQRLADQFRARRIPTEAMHGTRRPDHRPGGARSSSGLHVSTVGDDDETVAERLTFDALVSPIGRDVFARELPRHARVDPLR
jgi:hypothetical protein